MTSSSLPDYLWGIETYTRRIWTGRETRFQTTYEELKLESKSSVLQVQSGFQTTYEELKRHVLLLSMPAMPASRLPMRNWNVFLLCLSSSARLRFQTTYEELKRWRRGSSRSDWASRLPMRNWNFQHTDAPIFWVFWLPDYLWGIETLVYEPRKYTRRRFQTTYEELKRYPSFEAAIERTASRLPMRNWNSWWR